jgi:O-antigen/teichoic acid export membrane protein
MRRYAVPLFAANAVALATIGISYLLYSRLLTAQQFAMYSAALAVGNLATLVLDGGVKVTLIKHRSAPTPGEERAILHLMVSFSIVLLIAVLCLRGSLAHFYPALRRQSGFVASFTGVYLLSYPWIALATAHLERRLDYSRLAWIESAGLVLERGTPAIVLSLTGLGMYSFVWSLALGRLVRLGALACYHRVPLGGATRESYRSALQFLHEGLWYQVGLSSSLIRDNLYLLLIGPLYGAAWVGYYAWGLQLCIVASQVFVQISARISVPIAAQTPSFSDRWRTVVRQVGLLTAITAPILAAAIIVAPAAIHQLFADKWRPALTLLPYLLLRMLPGAATAPIGALVLVERGAKVFARVVWLWTLVEVAAGATATLLLGTGGLAVSYAFAAWVGIYLMLLGLNRDTLRLFSEVALAICTRPALWAALIVAAPCVLAEAPGREWLSRADLVWPLAIVGALIAAVYVIDSDLRSTFLRGRH